MTSSDQEKPGALLSDAEGTQWTGRQTLAVTVGALISTTLWILTPIAHSVTGGWLSNLAWTAAATATLGTLVLTRSIIGSHRDERRMRRVESIVERVYEGQERLYDRQEQLAGEIQEKQRADAEDMLARQQEVVDQVARWLEEHHKSLDSLRKRLGKLVALQEQRDRLAKVRSEDFEANARVLTDHMDALALLIETRMPPRQLGYKHRGDGS